MGRLRVLQMRLGLLLVSARVRYTSFICLRRKRGPKKGSYRD